MTRDDMTPTLDAEEARHRADHYASEDHDTYRLHAREESRTIPDYDPTAPADPRYARIREALAAAADPDHLHHAAEVRNASAMRAEVPLMVALAESIQAVKA